MTRLDLVLLTVWSYLFCEARHCLYPSHLLNAKFFVTALPLSKKLGPNNHFHVQNRFLLKSMTLVELHLRPEVLLQ
jgi:hypothetical protein